MGTDAGVSEAIAAAQTSPEPEPILEQVTRARRQAETAAMLAALNTMRWNRKKAAALLKIDHRALLYKMKKLRIPAGLDPETAMNDNGDVGAGAPPLAETNSTGQAEACPTVRSAFAGQLKPPISPAIQLQLSAVIREGGVGEPKNGRCGEIVLGDQIIV